jgi:hypothetical protein
MNRLRLLCGDAKVLTDLAIQRHMGDADFLRRLQAQPCYDELYPYFSQLFRQEIGQRNIDHDGRAKMAEACRKELERLEHDWRLDQTSPLDLDSSQGADA